MRRIRSAEPCRGMTPTSQRMDTGKPRAVQRHWAVGKAVNAVRPAPASSSEMTTALHVATHVRRKAAIAGWTAAGLGRSPSKVAKGPQV